jgi:hypothetical protein
MTDETSGLAVLTRLELYFSIRQLTRTMRRFAELLNFDYDTVMIFFIVAESCFQSIIPLGGAAADAASVERAYLDSLSLGLSILNIGEASGIPRETVRRKVKTLIDRGLLATLDKGRGIYVPLSALLERDVLAAFERYASDVEQLVNTVQFYGRRAP